jgi:hypothetical protein
VFNKDLATMLFVVAHGLLLYRFFLLLPYTFLMAKEKNEFHFNLNFSKTLQDNKFITNEDQAALYHRL